jgi:hypothetical protein
MQVDAVNSSKEMEMSSATAAPELVQDAAQNLAGTGSSLVWASSAVADPTTGIAAAEDEVSLAITSTFGGVGQEFQALSPRSSRRQSCPPTGVMPLESVDQLWT